jgi:hypothetical protein
MKRYAFLLPVVLSCLLGSAQAATPAAAACAADLNDIARFLPVNDAGASAELADHGPAIARAFQHAKTAAAKADQAACDDLLLAYVRTWRPGHISVVPAEFAKTAGVGGMGAKPSAVPDPLAPRFVELSADTAMLVFPAFGDRYKPDVTKLLDEHRAQLESHKNWIIDVRGNGGGSDSTYEPLLGWLLDSDFPSYSVEYYVTPANIKAQETICAMTSDPKGCWKGVGPVVDAMKQAKPGSWVVKGGKRMSYDRPEHNEPRKPARVAVLVDRHCGSSCEQFLLEARTGFRVKLVGQSSYGSLDVSNLRGHTLPSGRVLYYATTRSTRLPDMTVDVVGIAPDILLPTPADAAGKQAQVRQVQRWLEGGALGD